MENDDQNASNNDTENNAYFTNIPPVEPQKLVLVGDYPETNDISKKMQQLLSNILKIEYYSGVDIDTENSDRQTHNTNATVEDKAKRAAKSRYRKMRQLLYQLINDLPIPDSAICSDTLIDTKSLHPSIVSQSSKRGSVAASPKKPRSFCSIAVQARNNSPDRALDNSGDKDDWMGGVRALRDSHVRLVQRQLRHIERLNRALDRVSRPSHPRASAKQIHV